MIIRILGEGQFELPDSELDALNRLDDDLMAAVQRRDQAEFERSLEALLSRVRDGGSSCADDFLGESDFVLPDSTATLDAVAELLAEDGLVPG